MPGSALVGPIVSGAPEPDPALYREIVIDPTARSGRFRFLQDAVDYVRARATSATPWLLRILPGDYALGANRIILPNNCWMAGAGMSRTRILTSTTLGVDTPDPLISIATTADVRLSDLTILHNGPLNGTLTGPIALYGGGPADSGPYGVRLVNVRLDGTYAGYYDFSGGHDLGPLNDFELAERDETNWFEVRDCEIFGHYATAFRFMRKGVHAFNSKFICDIPASAGDLARAGDAPNAIRIWDFPSRIVLFGCDIRLIVRNSLTLGAGSGNHLRVGAIRDDDTGASDVLLQGCRVGIDISQGDIDQSAGIGRILVAAINIGGSGATGHHHRIEGSLIEYLTPSGGLTSCSAVGGIIIANNSALVQTNNLSMEGSEIRDLGGAGGTVRKDLIIDRQTGAFKPPGSVHVSGSKVPSLGNTTNTYTLAEWAALATTPNTINRQRGTATLVAGTVVVTLPVGYPTNCTDYTVLIEPFGDLVTITKTATTFTVTDITNGAATNTFAWAVLR